MNPQSVFVDTTNAGTDPFVDTPTFGTGSETLDSFIANRVALMSDTAESKLEELALAQANVKKLPPDLLDRQIGDQVFAKTVELMNNSLNYHAVNGDVESGVADAKDIQDGTNSPSNVNNLAYVAVKYLDQFPKYSIPREVARRHLLAGMISMKMEEAGIAPEDWKDAALSFGAMLLPGRMSLQFASSGDFSLKEDVKRLQGLTDEEFFKEFPKALDSVLEMSGGNPFYFLERMQAYLDPSDIKSIYAFLAADTVGVLSMYKVIPAVIKTARVARAANTPAKILRDTGQAEEAAKLLDAAGGDPAAAKTAQTNQHDAVQAMSPFGGEGLDPAIVEHLQPHIQKLVADRVVAANQAVVPLHDPKFLLGRKYWTPKEIEDANAKYLAKFAGNAQIVRQEANGAVIRVEIQKPSIWPKKSVIEKRIIELQDTKKALKKLLANAKARGQGKDHPQVKLFKESIDDTREELVRLQDINQRLSPATDVPKPVTVEEHFVRYTNDDFGNLDAVQYSKSLKAINSPSTNINQMFAEAVETATLADFDTARYLAQFFKARQSIIGGLGRKSRKKLDSILLQGDKDGVKYSNIELLDTGVMTPDGLIKFTKAGEVGAYHAAREVFDQLHVLKNGELHKELTLQGAKAVSFKIVDAEVLNFVNPSSSVTTEDLRSIQRIFDYSSNQVVDANLLRSNPEAILNKKIYRFKYPQEVGNEVVNYVIGTERMLKELPLNVLNKRVGYVPKINKNVFFVAERISPKLVDGVMDNTHRSTARFFDNPKDAQAWVAEQRAKGEPMELRTGQEWMEFSPSRSDEYEARIFGGLYGGKRAESDIPFGLNGTEAERMGGIEAMEAYMNHLARKVPTTEWRAGLIHRFLNSSRNIDTGESYLEVAGDWKSAIKGTTPKEIKSGLEAMQAWVKEQVRIPTKEERVWKGLTESLARVVARAPGSIGRTGSRALMNIGAKDAFTQMRGLAFHATLGWFNPSQFLVQGFGASFALSQNPVKAPLVISRMLALRAAMFAKSEENIRKIAKAAFLPEDTFVAMVRGYQKTGLHEATLTTGDYAALEGLPHGMDTLRWVADKGLIFFKEGERFSRNYSWIQAWDEVTMGGKLLLTDEMVDKVTKLSLQYSLNLNRANRAWWQKGMLSIPTQFYQISAKFIENMLPNVIVNTPTGWTTEMKTKILLGQFALFGMAGLPFGDTMGRNFLHWLQSEEDYGLAIKDPVALDAYTSGLVETMISAMTGERVDVANRLSVPAGIETMIELLADDQTTAVDALMGVTGSISSRTWDAVKLNTQILRAVVDEPENFDPSVVEDVFLNVTDIVSTFRNYRKAATWERLQALTDRKGNHIFPINDESGRATIMAQKLGIGSKVVKDYYVLRAFNKQVEEDYRLAADKVVEVSNRYYNSSEILTNQKLVRRMQAEISLVLSSFTLEEKKDIMNRVNNRLKQNNYALPEAIEKAIDNLYKKHGSAELQGVGSMIMQEPK